MTNPLLLAVSLTGDRLTPASPLPVLWRPVLGLPSQPLLAVFLVTDQPALVSLALAALLVQDPLGPGPRSFCPRARFRPEVAAPWGT